MNPDWRWDAACAGTPLEHWVSDRPGKPTAETRAVRALCDICPVQPECLADSLSVPAAFDQGYKAGLTYKQRNRIRPNHSTDRRYFNRSRAA